MKKLKQFFPAGLAMAALAFPGCDIERRPAAVNLPQASNYKQGSQRFQIERIAVFEDSLAYQGTRGIYLIRDTQTGQVLFGVSGIGVAQLVPHKSGKATVEDER